MNWLAGHWLTILGYVALGLYTVRLVRKGMRESYNRGIAQGFTVGYCTAMDRVRLSIERTNAMANLAESMDDAMDGRQYASTLQQSLIVTLGVHDAEQRGML